LVAFLVVLDLDLVDLPLEAFLVALEAFLAIVIGGVCKRLF
jgi:hypothetical protein